MIPADSYKVPKHQRSTLYPPVGHEMQSFGLSWTCLTCLLNNPLVRRFSRLVGMKSHMGRQNFMEKIFNGGREKIPLAVQKFQVGFFCYS